MYNVESPYIAVSKDKSRYTFLKANEIQMCLQSPLCSLHTPLFKTSTYKSCVMALYMKDTKTVADLCTPIISKTPTVPKIYQLSQGHLVVVTNSSIKITTTCHKRTPRVMKQIFQPGLE